MNLLIEDSQVLLVADDGKIIWKGFPGNRPALKAKLIEDQKLFVVLHQPEGWDFMEGLNLRAYLFDGQCYWTLQDKEFLSGDSVVDFQIGLANMTVNTWYGKFITIDLKKWRIISMDFTK